MDISLVPDYYEPAIDDNGNYVDRLLGQWPTAGLKCACASRVDFCYSTKTRWTSHIKSQRHKSWVSNLNDNKANHYVELRKKDEVLQMQKGMLTERDIKIQQQSLIIVCLSNQLALNKCPLVGSDCPTADLLN